MNLDRGLTLCVITLCFLSYLGVSDGRTATTKVSPTATTKAALTTTKKNVTRYPARTGGKIITLRFGGDDGNVPAEQCECRLFYLCEQGNTVDTTQNGQNCEDNYVCCKIDIPAVPTVVTSSTDPPATPTSPAVVSDCTCVQPEQCIRTDEEKKTGAGILDVRTTKCKTSEICCNPDNVVSDTQPPETPPVVTPSEVPPTNTPNPVNSDSDCGIRNTGIDLFNRIVSSENSKNTSFGEFPWMALLLTAEIDATTGQRWDNVFVCGASLISSKIVLTAGHCVHDVSNVNLLKVRVGEYDTRAEANKEQKPHQDRQVAKITQHPSFNPKTLYNDFALLEVVEPFVFDYHIRPVCIPLISSTYDYDPTNCVATGWGKNAFGADSQYPNTLKKVDLTIVPNDRCQEELRKTRLGEYFILDPSFMCAKGEGDTCEGDGGGPLMCLVRNVPNKYVQVGIVSWGIGCANGLPAAYASLEKNLDWLTTEFNAVTVFGSSIGERKAG